MTDEQITHILEIRWGFTLTVLGKKVPLMNLKVGDLFFSVYLTGSSFFSSLAIMLVLQFSLPYIKNNLT